MDAIRRNKIGDFVPIGIHCIGVKQAGTAACTSEQNAGSTRHIIELKSACKFIKALGIGG